MNQITPNAKVKRRILKKVEEKKPLHLQKIVPQNAG
jgi:hypothetical protein